jgi:hypothetical protein
VRFAEGVVAPECGLETGAGESDTFDDIIVEYVNRPVGVLPTITDVPRLARIPVLPVMTLSTRWILEVSE